jgi:hypothetical protein
VVTDGPFLEIGLDRDDDGSWYEQDDLMIGDDGLADPTDVLPLKLRWASLPEFGPITSIQLKAGDGVGTTTLTSFDPNGSGQGYGGAATVDLGTFALSGTRYLRAELLTDDGQAGHRAYTNPIWITFAERPAAITDLTATLAEDVIHLSWSAVTEDEGGQPVAVDYYIINRYSDPNFAGEDGDSIGTATGTAFDDSASAAGDPITNHYYNVRAVNALGMKSVDSNIAGEFDRDLINTPAIK